MNTREIDIELRSAVMGVITDVWDRSKQIDDAADEVLDLIEAAYCKRRGEPVDLDRYDAGFLGGQDGMPAYVWHDIIRAELDRAYDFYMDQIDRAMCDRTWEKAMAWQPIATAPKDGARLHARDAEGVERATWFSYGDWVYDGWRETEDQQGYQTEECWEPTEWNAST